MSDIDQIKKSIVDRLINLLENDPNKFCYNLGENQTIDFPIYRIISIDRLFQMLIENKITLVRTSLWDDVYENYFLKTPLNGGSYKHNLAEHMDGIYGQCWTLLHESDALWRIYSPNTRSIKIKTTLKKLLLFILKSKEYNPTSNFGISAGIVRYHSKEYFKNLSEKLDISDIILNITGFILNSLFLKREEFFHEQEIRIVIRETISEDYYKYENEILKEFSVDSVNLIDSIVFDPRCDDSFYWTYKKILNSIGYNGLIEKSKLYELE